MYGHCIDDSTQDHSLHWRVDDLVSRTSSSTAALTVLLILDDVEETGRAADLHVLLVRVQVHGAKNETQRLGNVRAPLAPEQLRIGKKKCTVFFRFKCLMWFKVVVCRWVCDS